MTAQPETQSRVRAFQKRFQDLGYGYRPYWLLCLAAFPIAVTPELLYRLWNNFRRVFPNDPPIERVAVADVLLWPAWRETAPDVFELDEDVRNELLSELRQLDQRRRGEAKEPTSDLFKELAQFLYQYTTQTTTGADGSLLRQAQLLGVQATLVPGQAARQVETELAKCIEDGNEPEILRMRNLVGALASLHADFETLLSVTKSLKAGLLGMPPPVWQRQVDRSNEAREGNVTSMAFGTDMAENEPYLVIPLLREMEGQLTLPEREGPEQPKRLFLLTVGIDDYPGMTLAGCVNDAELLSDVLPNYFKADNQQVIKKRLLNKEATKTAILEAVKSYLNQAGPDDIVVFTFSGHGWNAQKRAAQNSIATYGMSSQVHALSVSEPEQMVANTITETEFRELVHTARRSDPHVLLITDADNGNPDWLNPANPKHIILTGGSNWDTVDEFRYEGEEHGAFTAALVTALRSARARASQTYHSLIRNIYQFMQQENLNQTPQLFGTETALRRPFLSTTDLGHTYAQELARYGMLLRNPRNEDRMDFTELFELRHALDQVLEKYAGYSRTSEDNDLKDTVKRFEQAITVEAEDGLSVVCMGCRTGLDEVSQLTDRLADFLADVSTFNTAEIFFHHR